ncbi:MAG: glycoside hydrolase family protein [Pseudomonadota bacterium]|nr:glycoside hydrolase family protein [Pseudomonadota bacterium]
MTPENLALLDQELRRDEGVRNMPYKDSRGFNTVGVGHNIDAKPLPSDWTFPLSDTQINQLLNDDLQDTFEELDHYLGWWDSLDDVRQRVLANMCFNMGIGVLLEFTNTLADIKAQNWEAAAYGMLHSLWAKEVGPRAGRLAFMMKYGKIMAGTL